MSSDTAVAAATAPLARVREIDDVLARIDAAPAANLLHGTMRARLLATRAEALAECGREDDALRDLRLAVALAPYDAVLSERYETALARHRRVAAQPVVLIVTCERYFTRAVRTAGQLRQLGDIHHRLVIGADASVPADERVLRVEAGDEYEALPTKVAAALSSVFATYGTGTSVFKMDDDVDVVGPEALARTIRDLPAGVHDYAGFPVGGPSFDRTWHWRKCRRPELNAATYGRRYHGDWAIGLFYYLSARALRAFALAHARFPGEIQAEYFEDKYVGDTLRREGFSLTTLRPDDVGIRERREPEASRDTA